MSIKKPIVILAAFFTFVLLVFVYFRLIAWTIDINSDDILWACIVGLFSVSLSYRTMWFIADTIQKFRTARRRHDNLG